MADRVTDNSPLLRIGADSTLNNKIARGDRYNKRMNILSRDSPDRSYMRPSIDLSFPDQTFQKKNKIPVNQNVSVKDVVKREFDQSIMVVSKDNEKPNNKVMSSLQYVNGKNNRLE